MRVLIKVLQWLLRLVVVVVQYDCGFYPAMPFNDSYGYISLGSLNLVQASETLMVQFCSVSEQYTFSTSGN